MKPTRWFEQPVLAVVAWAALIWIASSFPSQSLPSVSVFGLDKVVHFSVYGVLGLLLSRWLSWPMVAVTLVCAAYGVIDEWHQSWVPGRDSSMADVVADVMGGAAGSLAWRWWRRRDS